MSRIFQPFSLPPSCSTLPRPAIFPSTDQAAPAINVILADFIERRRGTPLLHRALPLRISPKLYIDFPKLLICISYDNEDKIVNGCTSSKDH